MKKEREKELGELGRRISPVKPGVRIWERGMSLELIYITVRKMELFSYYIHRRKARLLTRHKLLWEGNLSHADASSLGYHFSYY